MWRNWILAMGAFALGTDLFVIAGILPEVARDMKVSAGEAGWLVSAFAFTYAVASPLLAVATGNVGRRNLLIASFGVFCAANAVSAVAGSYEMLLASRILAAMGAALYMPTASALAASLAPEGGRGRALAIVTGGLTVALVLGVPIGTWIGNYEGWRMTFWFVTTVGVFTLMVIGMGMPEVANVAPVELRARLKLVKNPQVYSTLALTVLWTAGGFSIYPYLGVILTQATHLTIPEAGWILLLFGMAAIVGNLVGGYGADVWGARKTIAIALGMLIVIFSSLAVGATYVTTITLSVVLWGVAGWMLTPPQQHRLIGLAPQATSVILGLNGSAIYLGMGIGTSFGALVLQHATASWLGLMGAAFEMLALVLLAMGGSKRQAA